jgi:tetratricopeptide (TPR) repeat protein
MKKTTFVVLLLLSTQCVADTLSSALQSLESQWASIYYKTPKARQGSAYRQLLEKATQLKKQHPKAAEPIFWEAVIKAASADTQGALSALSLVNEAKELLQKAISINPNAMDGAAYVTLGTLYYMVPKWPIAFGDSDKAQKLLETALKINPNGIDSNYYYGDFLLTQDRPEEAKKYFENAANAPVRPEQVFADSQLKTEAQKALDQIRRAETGKKIIASFSSATSVRY